jgi:hypothetical protein
MHYMSTFKKLIFAPFFIAAFAYLLYVVKPLLSSTDIAFGLSVNAMLQLGLVSCLMLLASFLFILFCTLSQDWKYIFPVTLIASVIPFLLFPIPYSYLIALGTLASLNISNTILKNKLNSYLNFQPVSLTFSPTKTLATFLVLVLSFTYYLILDVQISKQGFQLPDSLIDLSLKMLPQLNTPTTPDQTSQLPNFKLPADECALLKKNPELVRKQLPDPSILDAIDPNTCEVNTAKLTQTSTTSASSSIKDLIKPQLQQMLNPYKHYIAPVLAVLLATSLGFLNWVLSFILAILIWLIFWLLTATGFIKFELEMRQVKKLVV